MNRDLVVIGASAGGLEALRVLFSGLPRNLQAAVAVVLHTSGRSESLLPQILGRAGVLPVSHPDDGTVIETGHAYIAPPDRHMLVSDGVLRVLQGPRENLHRPAIDPLFRSAAVARGQRVIGVILSGMLDDGTSGLMVIKAHGGATIVQNPETAMFSAMPQNALEQVRDARVLPPEQIAAELVRLTAEPLAREEPSRPRGIAPEQLETQLLERQMPEMEPDMHVGRPSPFACPDCGGVLWEMDQNGLLRFRCRVGHAFTAHHLDAQQQHAIETALWSALRALEESAGLYERMAERAAEGNHGKTAGQFRERVADVRENARVLRDFLTNIEDHELAAARE